MFKEDFASIQMQQLVIQDITIKNEYQIKDYNLSIQFTIDQARQAYKYKQIISFDNDENQVFDMYCPSFIKYKQIVLKLYKGKNIEDFLALDINDKNVFKMSIIPNDNCQIYVWYIQQTKNRLLETVLPRSDVDMNQIIYRQASFPTHSCLQQIMQDNVIASTDLQQVKLAYKIQIYNYQIDIGYTNLQYGNYLTKTDCIYDLEGYQLMILDQLIVLLQNRKKDLVIKITNELNQVEKTLEAYIEVFTNNKITLPNIQQYNILNEMIKKQNFFQILLVNVIKQENFKKFPLINRINYTTQNNLNISGQIQAFGQNCFIIVSQKELDNIANIGDMIYTEKCIQHNDQQVPKQTQKRAKFDLIYCNKSGSYPILVDNYSDDQVLYFYKCVGKEFQWIITYSCKELIAQSEIQHEQVKIVFTTSKWLQDQEQQQKNQEKSEINCVDDDLDLQDDEILLASKVKEIINEQQQIQKNKQTQDQQNLQIQNNQTIDMAKQKINVDQQNENDQASQNYQNNNQNIQQNNIMVQQEEQQDNSAQINIYQRQQVSNTYENNKQMIQLEQDDEKQDSTPIKSCINKQSNIATNIQNYQPKNYSGNYGQYNQPQGKLHRSESKFVLQQKQLVDKPQQINAKSIYAQYFSELDRKEAQKIKQQKVNEYKDVIRKQNDILKKQQPKVFQIIKENETKNSLRRSQTFISDEECNQLNSMFKLSFDSYKFDEQISQFSKKKLSELCAQAMITQSQLKQSNYVLSDDIEQNEKTLQDQERYIMQLLGN